jgi:imidazoleglycerol-phosphate dehydratase
VSRSAEINRKTSETDVELRLELDGAGAGERATGVGFFDHLLDAVARHGGLDLDVRVDGDLETGPHHTVEDTGLALGRALDEALGDRAGIVRYGHAVIPMDEARAGCAVDVSGRPFLVFEAPIDREMLLIHKDFPFALVEEFFKSFANKCACNIHVDLIRGRNGHHAAEAIFKAFAVAMRAAKEVISSDVPSTKGVI